MLKLYNKEHEAIGVLTNLKDYKIEYVLSGEDLLEFSLSISDENIYLVEEEGYIRTKDNEYVIKAIDPSDNFKRFSCNVNIEALVGKAIASFDTSNNNVNDTIRLAIAGTGWILADNNITKRRTVRLTNTNALEVLREVRKVFRVDFRYDAINKIIYVYEQFGEERGVYFSDELNLKSFSIPSDTYDYVTRLYPKGKDGLTIASINNGKEYIENFQYSNKVLELIWEDNRYTDVNSLKEDAEFKLDELSKPKRTYQASISDLAKQSEEYNFLDFFLGDTITLLSKQEKFRDKQRIVKYIQYPGDPSQNSCELGNTTLTFEELQKENEAKNNTVDAITSDNGTVDGSKVDSITTEQISDFEASVAKITDLTVINADITNLKAQNVTITGELNAVKGEFGTLKANVGVIDNLTVTHTAQINNLKSNSATITQLNAVSANIGTLESEVGKIQTLVNGNLSSENIQAGGITSDKLTIANGFITNAMIASLDVSKVNAGDISTNKFRIKSDDGGIEIVGATQQFKDKNNKVRVQIGQDTQGNFNFILRGEDGTTTLIDHTGVKAGAIADNLIISDMIANDAVGEKQINYSSFVTGFNKDTNTSTIKSTKIMLNNQNQTLELAFNSLKTQADATKNDLNNLDIGGRNLALNSGNFTDTENWASNINGGTITIEDGFIKGLQSIKHEWVNLKPSATYMITLEFKTDAETFNASDGNGGHFHVQVDGQSDVHYGKKSCVLVYKDTYVKNEFCKYVYKIVVKDNVTNPKLRTMVYHGDGSLNGKNIWIKSLMVEEGNKATDWSPAPEDIDSEINNVKSITESHSTTIGVMQGQISTAINNTKIVKDGKTILLKDDYNRTVATIDSMKSTIGSHTSQISGLNSTVSTQGSSIEQLKGQISLKVEQTDISTAINNLEIGGRNLLLNSNFSLSGYWSDWGKPTIREYITYNNKRWCHIKSSGTANYQGIQQNHGIIIEPNTKYTFSIKIYGAKANQKFSMGIHWRNSISNTIVYQEWKNNYTVNATTSATAEILTFTFTTRDVDIDSFNIMIGTNDSTTVNDIYFTEIKFEKGGKVTDWTPAPEDVQSQIDTHTTQITTTNNKVSEIKTDLSSITSRVGTVESKQTTTDGKVTSLETWKKSAENKITESAIISTVSTEFYKKGETDNKYASQTQITQLSNQISSKVDVNGVKTVIQQNPESVMIGFNNISDSFLVNEHGLLCNNTNGNKSIAIQKGNLYYYNQYDNSKFLGGIIPRITTSDYLKGFGVLASKHCNTFQISHTDQWDNDSQWEIPGTIYPDFWINYKDITSNRGDLKGIHLGMTTYADNNILGNQSNSISGFNSISATSMCYDHWRSLVDNSIVARFDGGTNKILLGKNLNGNGFILENFASVNVSKIYLDSVYAYNGNYGKILFRTDGWNMYNGVNWDWQGYNILSPNIIGGSYGYSATLSSTRSYKTSIDTSSILDCINIVEPINTFSKSSKSSLEMDISQLINHPNADMFIYRNTNNVDMKSMLHLALLEIQKLKKEVQEIRAS